MDISIPFQLVDNWERISDPADRARRRHLAALLQFFGRGDAFGEYFDRVDVHCDSANGDPVEVHIGFRGDDVDAARLAALQVFGVAKEQASTSLLKRSGVLRPLTSFQNRKDDSLFDLAMEIEQRASQRHLGPQFLGVKADNPDGLVIFAFTDYQCEGSGTVVDAFRKLIRAGAA